MGVVVTPSEAFARMGSDEAFEFQLEKDTGNLAAGELGFGVDGIDGRFLDVDGVEDGGFEIGQMGALRRGQRLDSCIGLRREERSPFFEDIVGGIAEAGSVLDELVAAGGGVVVEWTGDGEDGATVFCGEVGGDEGATFGFGGDDERGARHSGDDAVADGKGLSVAASVKGKLTEDGAVLGDGLEESFIFDGIGGAHPIPEDGDRAAIGFERASVREGIDAASAATDNREAGARERSRESLGIRATVARHRARTDNGDSMVILREEIASDVENDGGIVDLFEEGRVFRIRTDERARSMAFDAALFLLDIHGSVPPMDGGRGFGSHARGVEEFGNGRAEDAFRRMEPVQ